MKSIAIALLGMLFVYMMGAFYNVSFDIGVWSDTCRFFSLIGFGLAFVVAFSYDQV
jgi:hypothetical protein